MSIHCSIGNFIQSHNFISSTDRWLPGTYLQLRPFSMNSKLIFPTVLLEWFRDNSNLTLSETKSWSFALFSPNLLFYIFFTSVSGNFYTSSCSGQNLEVILAFWVFLVTSPIWSISKSFLLYLKNIPRISLLTSSTANMPVQFFHIFLSEGS